MYFDPKQITHAGLRALLAEHIPKRLEKICNADRDFSKLDIYAPENWSTIMAHMEGDRPEQIARILLPEGYDLSYERPLSIKTVDGKASKIAYDLGPETLLLMLQNDLRREDMNESFEEQLPNGIYVGIYGETAMRKYMLTWPGERISFQPYSDRGSIELLDKYLRVMLYDTMVRV